MDTSLTILVDSREQAPYTFDGYDCQAETVALDAGDYSIRGFEDRVAIERKSLDDLVGSITGDRRARFERELARARRYELFSVVVEADLKDVSGKAYRSEMKPHAVLQSLIAFQVRYGTAFIWAGNRAGAEYMVFWLFDKYIKEIAYRYKRAYGPSTPRRIVSCSASITTSGQPTQGATATPSMADRV